MSLKQTIQWLLTFSALSLFTIHFTQHFGERGVQVAYAETIASESSFDAYSQFTVFAEQQGAQSVIRRMIDRFSRKADQEKQLCGLTQQQEQALRQHFDVYSDALRVGSRNFSVAHVSCDGKGISRQEAEDIVLQAGLPNIHCKTFEVYEQILFLLSAHLS